MTWVQVAVSGILLGGVYATVAVGVSLVFGVMRMVNFSHGDFLMWGMYAVLGVFNVLGLYPYLGGVLAAVVVGIAGYLLAWAVLNHFQSSDHGPQIVLTLSVSLMLQGGARLAFGGDRRSVNVDSIFGGPSVSMLGINISSSRLGAFLVATLATALLWLYLRYSWTGQALRAVAQDSQAARSVGIVPQRMFSLAMGIGTGCAGLAAGMLITVFPVYPEIGTHFLLTSFLVVVLGGLGHVFGAYWAGLLIGLTEAVTGYVWGSAYAQAVVFALFLILLAVRPQGLFRGAE